MAAVSRVVMLLSSKSSVVTLSSHWYLKHSYELQYNLIVGENL